MKFTSTLLLAGSAATAFADFITTTRYSPSTASASNNHHARAVTNCNSFLEAKPGDTCVSIVEKTSNAITFDDFVRWNPVVGAWCRNGLVAGTEYCVGIEAPTFVTPSSSPSSTPAGTPTKAVSASSKTGTCNGNFYQATFGDTCQKEVDMFGTMTLEEFVAANPPVGKWCSKGLLIGAYYFVGGDTTTATTSSTSRPARTSTVPP
jgi:hypothetical protein